jgi:hypothetical protein
MLALPAVIPAPAFLNVFKYFPLEPMFFLYEKLIPSEERFQIVPPQPPPVVRRPRTNEEQGNNLRERTALRDRPIVRLRLATPKI